MAREAHPAVVAGLRACGRYDIEGTLRLGHDVADCPVCGQMMRVDGFTFRCYAGSVGPHPDHGHSEIAEALMHDRRFVDSRPARSA